MQHPWHVRMTGPLAPHQGVIWSDLLSRGYSPLSARNLLRVAAHLSRWMYAEDLSPRHLTLDRLQAFLSHRIDCGYTCWRTLKGLEPILLPLRANNVVPAGEFDRETIVDTNGAGADHVPTAVPAFMLAASAAPVLEP